MNIKEDRVLYFQRLTDSVENLGILLSFKESTEDLEELVVPAKMRRLSLCFVAYINYIVERAGISKEERNELDYDEALEILYARGIIPEEDKDSVEEFFAMYSDIVTYDPLVSINEKELAEHIPHAYDYLLSFIEFESRSL